MSFNSSATKKEINALTKLALKQNPSLSTGSKKRKVKASTQPTGQLLKSNGLDEGLKEDVYHSSPIHSPSSPLSSNSFGSLTKRLVNGDQESSCSDDFNLFSEEEPNDRVASKRGGNNKQTRVFANTDASWPVYENEYSNLGGNFSLDDENEDEAEKS